MDYVISRYGSHYHVEICPLAPPTEYRAVTEEELIVARDRRNRQYVPCSCILKAGHYTVSEDGRLICKDCAEGRHRANEVAVPFCATKDCECVCAG